MNDTARLLAELDELREENRQLKEALAPVMDVPTSWGLTASEQRLFVALRLRDAVSTEHLRLCVLAHDRAQGSTIESMKVLLSKLRKKIAPHGYGIRSIYKLGYRLVPPSDDVADVCVAAIQSASRETRRSMQ